MDDDNKKFTETYDMPFQEIIEILKKNEPKRLIGVEENTYFECKSQSYMTNLPEKDPSEKYKRDLVIDITAIANSGGGVLCIGFDTDEKVNEKTEYVKAIKSVPKEFIRMKDWEDILYQYTIPHFRREWLSYGYSGENEKVFWIKIADVKEIHKYPILVNLSKKYEQGLASLREVFGFYERDRSVNVPYSPEKIHTYIQRGIENEDGNESLNRLYSMIELVSTKLDTMSSLTNLDTAKNILRHDRQKSIKNAVQKLDRSKGLYYIHAFPSEVKRIDAFWDQGEKSVFAALKDLPRLRPMGWDLNAAQSEYPYPNGDNWEIMNGNRKLTSYSINGRLFSAGSIDGFLDWGLQDYINNEEIELINAFALCEFVDAFFHTIEVFKTIYDVDSSYTITAGLIDNSPDIALFFPPHIKDFDLISSVSTEKIRNTQWKMEVGEDIKESPAYLAGKLIQQIYVSGFNYPIDREYPYLIKEETGYRVNEELYAKQG